MDDQAEKISGQEEANIASQAMDGMGIPEEVANEAQEPEGSVKEGTRDVIQERLNRQAAKHRREMRLMQENFSSMLQNQSAPKAAEHQPTESYTGQPEGGSDVNDQISKAVAAALRAKDEHEMRKKQEMAEKEQQEHMMKQYKALNDDFDKAAEKYEDFDDVVRHPDAPFTPAMRDYALTLPNRAEVLYKLGKNPEELKRISNLPALQQAQEMLKLSFALMGGVQKPEVQARPMGQIKGNPISSHAVTEKTPVSDIRQRMKNGGWK